MNNILITGLPLSDPEPEHAPCNITYANLFLHPSYVLWADKILIPKPVWSVLARNNYGRGKDEGILKLIIDMLVDAGVATIIDTSNILTDEVWDQIDSQIEKDISILKMIYSQNGIKESSEMVLKVNSFEYCFPRLRYIYASLFVSNQTHSQCVFDADAISFCNSKFGISQGNPVLKGKMQTDGFCDVFSAILPDEQWAPANLIISDCRTCAHMEDECFDKFLFNTEADLKRYLEWRDYDEIHQIKEVLSRIIKKRDISDGLLIPIEIKKEFEQEKEKHSRILHKRFPTAKKWSRYLTLLSAPAALFSLTTGNTVVGAVSESIAALGVVTSFAIDQYEAKHNWINFTLKGETTSQSN